MLAFQEDIYYKILNEKLKVAEAAIYYNDTAQTIRDNIK